MTEKEILHTLAEFVSYATRLRGAGFTEGFDQVMLYVTEVLHRLGKDIEEMHDLPS